MISFFSLRQEKSSTSQRKRIKLKGAGNRPPIKTGEENKREDDEMEKFLHYGKEVVFQEGEEPFVYTLKRKGVKYTELPIIIPEIKNSYVIKYEFEGEEKYAYIIRATETEKIYIMEQIPDDCDFYKVAIDEMRQSKGEEPMQIKTRARMMTEIAIQNVDSRKDPFVNFEEDYDAVYKELIMIGCPIWEIEEMDHHDISEDWIQRVKESNTK